MKKIPFPWLALGIGLFIAVVLLMSGAAEPGGELRLPLLTLLILAEFGFLLTAIGAAVGARSLVKKGVNVPLLIVVLGAAALAVGFLAMGLSWWPAGGLTGTGGA